MFIQTGGAGTIVFVLFFLGFVLLVLGSRSFWERVNEIKSMRGKGVNHGNNQDGAGDD